MKEEPCTDMKKIERRKSAGLDYLPLEVWKTRKVDVIRIQFKIKEA